VKVKGEGRGGAAEDKWSPKEKSYIFLAFYPGMCKIVIRITLCDV
jgi:hypothetical protein